MDKSTFKLLKLIYDSPGIKLSEEPKLEFLPDICAAYFNRYEDFIESLNYLHNNDFIRCELPFCIDRENNKNLWKPIDYKYHKDLCYPRFPTLKGKAYVQTQIEKSKSTIFGKIFSFIKLFK